MLELTLKNTRHGALPGNGYGGFCIATIQPPSPGSIFMEKRYCKACGSELIKRHKETKKQFLIRVHCDMDCKHEAMKVGYKHGQTLGDYGLIYLYETTPKMWHNNRIRRAEFKCTCGNKFTTTIGRVKIGGTKSCGCHRARLGREKYTKHGLAYDRLWHKWQLIKQRIFNSNNIGYEHYGGRGIELYKPWINDPKAFIDYCKTLEGWDNHKLTIDRIENDGHYKPGNIRFASNSIQVRNRNKSKRNTSGYIGVSRIKNKRWKSAIRYNNKELVIYRGQYKLIAAMKRDQYIINNDLPGYRLNLLERPKI